MKFSDFRNSRYITGLALIFSLFFVSPLQSDSMVYFNLSNNKVHKMTCHWGQVCTKNCSVIPRSEAYRRGGVACKVCGG